MNRAATGATGPAGPPLRNLSSGSPQQVERVDALWKLRRAVPYALIGLVVGLTFIACLALIAAGDPGGWAAWRVVLCSAWAVPVGAILGFVWGSLA